MPNTFELKPCIGIVIGTERDAEPQTITWDQDEIWCNGKRIGHVSHHEGAMCRVNRILTEPTKAELVAAIQQLRKDQGKPPVSDKVAGLPDPSVIKGVVNSAKRKK